MLRPDLRDYSDVFTVAKGRITAEEDNDAKTRNEKSIFKNIAPCCIMIIHIKNQ